MGNVIPRISDVAFAIMKEDVIGYANFLVYTTVMLTICAHLQGATSILRQPTHLTNFGRSTLLASQHPAPRNNCQQPPPCKCCRCPVASNACQPNCTSWSCQCAPNSQHLRIPTTRREGLFCYNGPASHNIELSALDNVLLTRPRGSWDQCIATRGSHPCITSSM
jgi:hypothetical protein